jgi:hypothetical protein
VHEEILVGLTEDALVLLVRLRDVLEAPRRPQLLRHSRACTTPVASGSCGSRGRLFPRRAVNGTGLAAVVRVYNVTKSGIKELDCAATKASGTAVGKKTRKRRCRLQVGRAALPAARERLSAPARRCRFQVGCAALPAARERLSAAAEEIALGTQVQATTLGATSDDGDPDSCGLAGGTVWYSVSPDGGGLAWSFGCTPQPISTRLSSS